jgi:hypothetical protein
MKDNNREKERDAFFLAVDSLGAVTSINISRPRRESTLRAQYFLR